MPLVSIIMSTYNCAATIGKAIASATAQAVHDIEIVVVDDASTDGTADIVTQLAAQDSRIKLVRLPQNIGSGGARHVAVDHAAGEWLMVLDADDWCEPNRVEIMLKAAHDLKADVILDNLQIYDHALGKMIETTSGGGHHILKLEAETLFKRDNPLKHYPIGYMQPMMRRAFLQGKKINYRSAYRLGEDFLLLAELVLSGARTFIIPDALYIYVHRTSPTTKKISPHSRSGDDLFQHIRGCDELMRDYASTMTIAARRALKRRKYIFQTWINAKQMKSAVEQRRFAEALRLIAQNPAILVFVANGIRKWVYTRIFLTRSAITINRDIDNLYPNAVRSDGRKESIMSKTIAIYLPDLRGGGIEWIALRLARGLAPRGFRVIFVLTKMSGNLVAMVQKEFEIVDLGASRSIMGVCALVRFLRQRRPNILIGTLPHLNVVAGLAAKLSFSKTRLILRESMIPSNSILVEHGLRRLLMRLAIFFIYPLADRIVAVSRAAAEDLRRLAPIPEHKMRVIYNPTIPPDFEQLAAPPPDHPWLQQHDQPVILGIGHLVSGKDFSTLIRAVAEVRRNSRPVRLIIIGEGGQRQELEQLIAALNLQDAVSLPGYRHNVFPYLKAADLFVMSSLSEGFANVIVEALACGTPVVSTDSGGQVEVLENGRYGALVPPGDSHKLAAAIGKALDSSHDREALRRRGLSYTIDRAAEQYASVFDSLIK